jgi:hypothetical protein
MSPMVALYIVTWAAIVLLFFGLAAVLREVRLLRGIVTRGAGGFSASAPEISLGGKLPGNGTSRIVLAADSGCPLCLAVVEKIRERGVAAILLTHERPEIWNGAADHLTVVSDQEVWREISHLSPPVLMRIDGNGSVRELNLPVREEEVDTVLDNWAGTGGEEINRVGNVRAHS